MDTHFCVASEQGLFIETIKCLKTYDATSSHYIQTQCGGNISAAARIMFSIYISVYFMDYIVMNSEFITEICNNYLLICSKTLWKDICCF